MSAGQNGLLGCKEQNIKKKKKPLQTHICIMRVLGCKDKNNINKPSKHAYTCPRGAKKENKQKKAPETQYAVFLVQGKKRK